MEVFLLSEVYMYSRFVKEAKGTGCYHSRSRPGFMLHCLNETYFAIMHRYNVPQRTLFVFVYLRSRSLG